MAGFVIYSSLFSSLASSSLSPVASIVLSILFHLHPYHAPIFGVAPPTLAFGKVSSFVDVSDIQVHCAIDDFIAMIDKIHCKATVK